MGIERDIQPTITILSMSENGVYPPNSICFRGKMMINIDKPQDENRVPNFQTDPSQISTAEAVRWSAWLPASGCTHCLARRLGDDPGYSAASPGSRRMSSPQKGLKNKHFAKNWQTIPWPIMHCSGCPDKSGYLSILDPSGNGIFKAVAELQNPSMLGCLPPAETWFHWESLKNVRFSSQTRMKWEA